MFAEEPHLESEPAGTADEPREGIRKLLRLSQQQLGEALGGFEEEVEQILIDENERTSRLEAAQQQLLSNGDKFEAVITAKFGDLSTFKGGLDAHIGLPDPKVFEAITREHEQSADSHDIFESGNHGLQTTPNDEFEFVVRPQLGKRYAGLDRTAHGGPGRMPIDLDVFLLAAGASKHPSEDAREMPEEPVLEVLKGPHGAGVSLVALTAAGMGEIASNLWSDLGIDWRSQIEGGGDREPSASMQDVIERVVRLSDGRDAAKLRELIVRTLLRLRKGRLSREEIICLRLYSGPMYFKYNALLRQLEGCGVVTACKGNKYCTTIHCIVSGIVKLSSVSDVEAAGSRKVYRGVSGMKLPSQFLERDEFGCRGAAGFMCCVCGACIVCVVCVVCVEWGGVAGSACGACGA